MRSEGDAKTLTFDFRSQRTHFGSSHSLDFCRYGPRLELLVSVPSKFWNETGTIRTVSNNMGEMCNDGERIRIQTPVTRTHREEKGCVVPRQSSDGGR